MTLGRCTQRLKNLVVWLKVFQLYFFLSFLKSTVIARDTSGFWVHVWVSRAKKVWDLLHQRRKKCRDMVSNCDMYLHMVVKNKEVVIFDDKVGRRKSWHGYLQRSLATYPSYTTQLWAKRWVSVSWLSVLAFYIIAHINKGHSEGHSDIKTVRLSRLRLLYCGLYWRADSRSRHHSYWLQPDCALPIQHCEMWQALRHDV